MKTDRLPPHDIKAEQGALGCMLLDPSRCIPEFQEAVSDGPAVFYDLRHQMLFSELLEMSSEGSLIDIITTQSRLRDKRIIEQLGGIEYLTHLMDDCTPSAGNLPHYIAILLDKLLLRKIIQTCSNIVATAYQEADPPETVLDNVERDILAIRGIRAKTGSSIREIVKSALTQIQETWERRGAIEGISTGFADLDKMTGGLKAGEMTVVAGYPGSGKTSLAMNIAEHLMCAGRRVGVFSLEMSAKLLVTRFICSHARVNLRNIGEGIIVERDLPKIIGSAGRISGSHIYLEDDSDLSIYQLRAKARRMSQQHKIEALVIDYIQLLTATGGARKVESRQQEVSDISRGVKAISRELHIPVIALSQLNDDGKLRESRAIGQDADNVWILKEKDEDGDPNITPLPMELSIAKARNGPRGLIDLLFLKHFTRFENASRIDENDIPRSPYAE